MREVNHRVLPGYGLCLGYTMFYLGLLVVVPLAACVLKASTLSPAEFWATVWNDEARAAYGVTIGCSLAAATINVVLGVLVAWVLVRYDFPLKRLFDALVDLPFALPTAVAGLVFCSLYAPDGWLGQYLAPLGVQAVYSKLAIVLVLIFTGFPFVVRTVQPVLESLESEQEEAAAILGAGRWQTFIRVIAPPMLPAVLTGFALAFARSLGEYGSVIFVSGNRVLDTKIAPVLIVEHLEAYEYAKATAIAVVLLVLSFSMLALINLLQHWSRKYAA
jgi:sulfate transport system permease protein